MYFLVILLAELIKEPYSHSGWKRFQIRWCITENFSLKVLNFFGSYIRAFAIILYRSSKHEHLSYHFSSEKYNGSSAHLNPTLKEIFIRQYAPHSSKCNLHQKIASVRTLSYGTETTSFRGSHLWNSLPNLYDDTESLHVCKSKIRQRNGSDCTCKLCK